MWTRDTINLSNYYGLLYYSDLNLHGFSTMKLFYQFLSLMTGIKFDKKVEKKHKNVGSGGPFGGLAEKYTSLFFVVSIHKMYILQVYSLLL